jgi:hypothetical protein
MKDHAINLFLSSQGLRYPRGYFEYRSTLRSKAETDDPISLGLNAVALAAYSNTRRSNSPTKEARKYLVLASKSANNAIECHQEATKDSTVTTAIMVLNTYETI